MKGVILYGPPAAGKDTITCELLRANSALQAFERLKVGEGRTTGYRIATAQQIAKLRERGEIVWENRRYGAVYVVDRPSLTHSLASGIPIVHLGQVEAIDAVVRAAPCAKWLVVYLWCPRQAAESRLIGRGSVDLAARLQAWDETRKPTNADLTINTADLTPRQAAQLILAALATQDDGLESS